MDDSVHIEKYMRGLSHKQVIRLTQILLEELIFQDEIRYSEERNTFYWETSGDELI